MSHMKRYYEETFDEWATWDNLRAQGLSEDDIEFLFDCFSTKRTWNEFIHGVTIIPENEKNQEDEEIEKLRRLRQGFMLW